MLDLRFRNVFQVNFIVIVFTVFPSAIILLRGESLLFSLLESIILLC